MERRRGLALRRRAAHPGSDRRRRAGHLQPGFEVFNLVLARHGCNVDPFAATARRRAQTDRRLTRRSAHRLRLCRNREHERRVADARRRPHLAGAHDAAVLRHPRDQPGVPGLLFSTTRTTFDSRDGGTTWTPAPPGEPCTFSVIADPTSPTGQRLRCDGWSAYDIHRALDARQLPDADGLFGSPDQPGSFVVAVESLLGDVKQDWSWSSLLAPTERFRTRASGRDRACSLAGSRRDDVLRPHFSHGNNLGAPRNRPPAPPALWPRPGPLYPARRHARDRRRDHRRGHRSGHRPRAPRHWPTADPERWPHSYVRRSLEPHRRRDLRLRLASRRLRPPRREEPPAHDLTLRPRPRPQLPSDSAQRMGIHHRRIHPRCSRSRCAHRNPATTHPGLGARGRPHTLPRHPGRMARRPADPASPRAQHLIRATDLRHAISCEQQLADGTLVRSRNAMSQGRAVRRRKTSDDGERT